MQTLPADFNPTNTPGYLLARIARALARRNDDLLAPLGVNVAWIPVLGALRRGEALTQKELARRAEIGQPAMAQMLARMERDRVLTSEPDPSDRRARRYGLTMAGMRLVEPAVATVSEANDELFGRMTTARQKMLLSLLSEISAALGEDDHTARERTEHQAAQGQRPNPFQPSESNLSQGGGQTRNTRRIGARR